MNKRRIFDLENLNDVQKFLGSFLPQNFKKGIRKAAEIMSKPTKVGAEFSDKVGDYVVGNQNIDQRNINLSAANPKFFDQLKEAGITPGQTPMQFLGAYTTRLATDVGLDASRQIYWRYNHPMALADGIIGKVLGPAYKELGPTQKAAIGGAISITMGASLGHLDITNPQELFRSKGFAQSYAEKGSEDRRQTGQPGIEFLERVAMGRQGRPLKYETAKEDIPDLTKERYSNYMRNYYQDKGITGMGLVKFTPENLEGVPEARVVGFPIGLQAVGAGVGGTATARNVLSRPNLRTGAKALSILGGALAGAGAGELSNKLIAQARKDRSNREEVKGYLNRTLTGEM